MKQQIVQGKTTTLSIVTLVLGIIIFVIGLLNLVLVHPVPGIVFLLISVLYYPPVTVSIREKFGLSNSLVFLVILAIIIIWFTLGVSDLGDIIDKWA